MTEGIRTICAWCRKPLAGDPRATKISHGICPACYERMTGHPPAKRENPTLLVMNPAHELAGAGARKSLRAGEDLYRRFHWTDADEVLEIPESMAPKGAPAVLTLIGRLESLVYRVPETSGKAGVPFEHEFSDRGRGVTCRHRKVLCGCRPLLCADMDGRLWILGGEYTIEGRGIVG